MTNDYTRNPVDVRAEGALTTAYVDKDEIIEILIREVSQLAEENSTIRAILAQQNIKDGGGAELSYCGQGRLLVYKGHIIRTANSLGSY